MKTFTWQGSDIVFLLLDCDGLLMPLKCAFIWLGDVKNHFKSFRFYFWTPCTQVFPLYRILDFPLNLLFIFHFFSDSILPARNEHKINHILNPTKQKHIKKQRNSITIEEWKNDIAALPTLSSYFTFPIRRPKAHYRSAISFHWATTRVLIVLA